MTEFESKQRQSQTNSLFPPTRPEPASQSQGLSPVADPLHEQGNQAMLRFAQSCPMNLPSASICPFGGVCHACPARVQTKLMTREPGAEYKQDAGHIAYPPAPTTRYGIRNGEERPAHRDKGQSPCSPTWYGDTTPEVDSKGNLTGKVITKYNDAELKDPCVRECVEEHEDVHVRQLTPVVKKIHDCDVAAGDDWERRGKCNAMATRELNEPFHRWECEAYRRSYTCLTLKVIDPKNPCSKSPHREQIQKHRGYEACEMKRHCAAAGTPALGVPCG